MTKELKDLAWACLPREFKEKVKKEYARCVKIEADDNPNLPAYAVKSAISRMALLEKLFGEHNLTSDAEGEEMLCCENYEPKPDEPKFKEGDRAIYCIPEKQRIKARVVNVRQRSGSTLFNTLFNYDIRLDDGRTANWVDEQWLLPDNDDQVRAVTKKASERFDKILAKDLRKEKRLRIATQLMAAMMSNPVMFNKESITVEYEDIVHGSLEYADALIAAAEKGGCQ